MMRNLGDIFSIVVPVYNRSKFIARTLDSIAAQTYRPLHLIVVDNNSTDGSAAIARHWAEEHRSSDLRITLLSEKKPGAAAARNCGLREVDSEWMCFFDSDDIMYPQFAARIMESRKGADMVLWRKTLRHPDSSLSTMRYTRRAGLRQQLYHAIASCGSTAIRTAIARNSGGWNENLLGWDDWEFFFRGMLSAKNIRYLKETLMEVTAHPDSITGTDFISKCGSWEKAIEAVRTDIRRSGRPDTPSLLRIADYRAVVLAGHYCREGGKEEARNLYRRTLRSASPRMKLILPLLYAYVSAGGRGAAILLDRLM